MHCPGADAKVKLVGWFEMVVWRVCWYVAMLGVTVLALLPVEHMQQPIFDWWDKAQHALAFVFLTVWALFLWPSRSFGVVMMMLAFGAGIEAAQWTVGWRFAEWTDFAADALGVLGAWGLWKMPHLRGSN